MATDNKDRLKDPARLAEVNKLSSLVNKARADLDAGADPEGRGHEAGLQSVAEAARSATGAEMVLFNVLDSAKSVTVVTSGADRPRGYADDVEQGFCQSVVRKADGRVTVIEDHPDFEAFFAERYQPGAGFYAGVGVSSPDNPEQTVGTLCIMDPRQASDVLKRDDSTGVGREQLLKDFAGVIQAQLKARIQLQRTAVDLQRDVQSLEKAARHREAAEWARRNFTGINTRDLINLAEELAIEGYEEFEARGEVVSALKAKLLPSGGGDDYESMRFRALLVLAESRGLDGVDDVESKAQLIELLRADDARLAGAPDYEAMKFRALLALAEERHLDGADDVESKTELIALLRAEDARQNAVPDYAGMKFKALLALAEERGLEGAEDVESKGELIALLSGAATGAPTADAPTPDPFAHPREWVDPADVERVPAHLPWARHIPNMDLIFDPYTAFGLGSGPPIRLDDPERIECVRSYGLLNPHPAPDPFLNELCKSAAAVVGPNALAIMNALGDEVAIRIAEHVPPQMDPAAAPPICTPRGTQACNYVVYKRSPVVLPSAELAAGTQGFMQFYTGIPMTCPTTGHALGSFCVVDTEAHPDFTEEAVNRLQMLCTTAMHHIELRKLRLDVYRLASERTRIQQDTMSRRGAPDGEGELTTFCSTDIEGSTALWESAPKAMNDAQRIHDDVMRKCIERHDGYEVATEGDAFLVAFHTPTDALAFTANVQHALLEAPWPKSLLSHDEVAVSDDGAWNGPRVRIGVHSGPARQSVHPVTKRANYAGDVVDLARDICDAAHGGQVLFSADAWASAHLNARKLDVSCIHLGAHQTKRTARVQLLQALPTWMTRDRDFSTRPPRTAEMMAPGYFQAPSGESEVVVCFVLVGRSDELMLLEDVGERAFAQFRDVLRSHLQKCGGYLCQEDDGTYMAVFAKVNDAVKFGTGLHAVLGETAWPDALKASPLFSDGLSARVGLFAGTPIEKRPHETSGRADYFGPVLNRAARVAYSAETGRTLMPRSLTARIDEETLTPLYVQAAGKHAFKGIADLIEIDDVALDDAASPPMLGTIALEAFNVKLIEALQSNASE